jgi:hypothetical protein
MAGVSHNTSLSNEKPSSEVKRREENKHEHSTLREM